MWTKYILRSLLALALIVLCAFFSLDINSYARHVEALIANQSKRHDVAINFEKSELSLTEFASHGMRVLFKNPPAFLYFDQLRLALKPLSLLVLKPAVNIHGKLYDGVLNGHAGHSLSTSESILRFNFKDIKLEQHPQIQPTGIIGNLNLNTDELRLSPRGAVQGQLDINLNQVHKLGAHKLDLRQFNLIGKVPIPELSNLNLDATVELSASSLKLLKLASDSSWGKVNGAGKVMLDKRQNPKNLDLELAIQLSESGYQAFGIYMGKRDFTLTLSGDAKRPRVEVS